jgi:dynein intermediate chain 2
LIKIWSEDFKEAPIMWTKHHNSYMLDGCWSPVRPAVFFTTQWDGTLNVWDFIFKQNDAALTVKVCDEPLSTVRVPDSGRYVAVGSQQGTVTVLELSERLSQLQPNEKQSTSAIFDRQLHREKTLEARNRELRLKERTASSRLKETSEPDVTADVFGGTTDGQKLIAESTKIFWDVISQGSAEREERRQKKAGEEAPKKEKLVSRLH